MQKVEAYRIEIPIVAKDEYSSEMDKADKSIDSLEKKVQKSAKAQDEFSKSSKSAAKAQADLSKSAQNASKGVQEVGKSAEQADKQVGRVTKSFQSFGSKVKSLQRAKATVELAVKDNATRVMDRVRGSWESFKRNPVTRLTVFAVDRAMRVLRGIKNTVLSIPTMITIGLSYVGIKNLGQATVGAAMNWEQYEVSMEHWLDGNIKQAKELTKWMGEFADITPFSSPELFPALTRAVAISDKDLDKSKRLLAVASDMAALTPDRSVEDAMQAIANSKMGNTVMLQGFGLDISKKQMDKMGGWDKLIDELEKKFAGGAEKLSKTAAGVLATLKGYRGSLMRSIGTGFLEPMKPRLDAINNWLAENQDTWGRWKDVAKGHGKDVSESIFSTLEKGFNHVRSNYLDNPEFMNLDLKGKITFISADLGGYLNDTVKPVLTGWWDETGSGVALEIGKSIGSGIIEGIKLGMQAGGELIQSSYSDLFTNFKETGFSKETGKSAAVAGAATLGAGYLAKKLIYNPAKTVYDTGKKTKTWVAGKNESRKTKRGEKQTKWTESNDRRIERRLARGEAKEAKRVAREASRTTKIPSNSSKLLKRVPLIGSALTAMSLFGATNEEIPGVAGGLAGGLGGAKLGAMGGAAIGSIVPGVGTAIGAGIGGFAGGVGGAIGGDKLMSWLFGPKKPSAAELPNKTASQQSLTGDGIDKFNTEAFNQSSQAVSAAMTAMAAQAELATSNIETLTMHLGEASGHVVGSFQPLSNGAGLLQQNIETLTMHLGEASGHVVGSFNPLLEQGPLLGQNMNALSINLGEASISTVGAFYPLNEYGPLMHQNMSALTTNLAESSSHVVGAFYPVSENGALLNGNLQTLTGWVGQASGWVATLYGIQDGASAVKSALSNLASRISSVPTPSVSAGSVGSVGKAPVRAYAQGGIATSPHVGLVGEAGVPEAMIPWDGSSRSKSLWQQTGEALGMFSGGTSGGSDIAAVGGGAAINIGDINIDGGNNMSAEEIMNMIMPALYEKIVASIAKR